MDGKQRPWFQQYRRPLTGSRRSRPPAVAVSPPTIRRGKPSAPPRVLFINQYYWPDNASTAQHLADLAESLAAQGFECHVLAGKGAYKPGTPPLPREEIHQGVRIHRVGATALGRGSTLKRMADYLSFYANAAIRCVTLPRFDVVVTLTTPPIIGLLGTLWRRFRGARHVSWSMDLHPDASVALGRMSPRDPAVRALQWLSDTVDRQADLVVALGPYMADRLAARGVRTSRLTEIPVWSRQDEIYPLPRENHPLRAQLGLDDQFVAMYSGNMGLAHTFDEFLEAARRLRDRRDITFLFVGGGPRRESVRRAQEEEGLTNIRFLDYFPREQLHASLSIADVHLISMRSEMTGIVVPGKLYGAMASERPCLFVGPHHCETADTIREADCGLTIAQGDVDGLVKALTALADDADLREIMGARGRAYFLDHHEKDACCRAWFHELHDLLGNAPRIPPQTRAATTSTLETATGAAS